MKSVSNKYKEQIKTYGRQIDTIITYADIEGEHSLNSDVLFSVTPTFNGALLKSVMKQLDFESSIFIPKDTEIKLSFGVLNDDLQEIEYINLGNYIISREPEYNADTLSYSYICYDKMLYSMKDYEKLNITYPTTIRNYINAICNKLGLTFANINDTFANYDKQVKLDLYEGYNYTFRDILDELAEVTASTICINENTDDLEIRYLNNTSEIIDEDYLKDVNVAISEKYGPINSIVLSRSAESDNVYLQDEDSIEQNGLCELKIIDNQIMNDNDRSDFLPDILDKLNGINYYINDLNTTGITWLELCDKYIVKIGENQYNCVLFNDEIKITQGLEETTYTELPEISETDYSKSDKTDRKINKAYIIVDKQNQKVESLVSQIGDRSQKTTTVTQDIDGIESKVEDLEDLTRKAIGIQSVIISDGYPNEDILELHIYGNNSVFDYLYPADYLYPDNYLYPYGDSRIRFYNDNVDTTIELGITEVLRANLEARDEVFIDSAGKVSLIRRVNTNGTTKPIPKVTELGELHFTLIEGNNIFEVVNYNAPIEIKYAIKSTLTDIFATKVEMNSSITQTTQEINLEVSKKVDENEVISKINQSAEQITIEAEKIGLTATDVLNIISGNAINLTAKEITIASNNFNVDKNGNMSCKNANISGTITSNNATINGGKIDINTTRSLGDKIIKVSDDQGATTYMGTVNALIGATNVGDIYTGVYLQGGAGGQSTVMANSIVQTSLEKQKKNFEKFDNGLDIVLNTDIYKFNYITQEDKDKKSIGFVIGENYKYSKDITDAGENGVNLYSMTSVAYKAIQEQQEQIKQLQRKIKELKGEK